MIKRVCECGGTAERPNPDCERCRLVVVFDATVRMRSLQKEYFNTRTAACLQQSKNAESYVDRLIDRLREVQPNLFE
jgi:predicted RNA-binding protein with PIN domain